MKQTLLLGLALLGLGLAQVQVEGDRRLWEELQRALAHLSSPTTYRMRVPFTEIEYDGRQNPPALRAVTSSGGIQTELVQIGQRAWTVLRMGQGYRPFCRQQDTAQRSLEQWFAPTRPQGRVQVLGRRAGEVKTPKGETRPVYLYTFLSEMELPGQGRVKSRTEVAVDRERGVPLQVASYPEGERGGGLVIQYYDFGASLSIALPPECQGR